MNKKIRGKFSKIIITFLTIITLVICILNSNNKVVNLSQKEDSKLAYKKAAITEISCSASNSMIIDNNTNKLWAWGANHKGELGQSSVEAYREPIKVDNGLKFTKIASEQYFTMGIDTNGNLWTWGYSEISNLGNGVDSDKRKPLQIKPGTKFKEIAVSHSHCVAIDTSGNLWTWGKNDQKQLGNGTTTDSSTPIQIKAGTKFTRISASYDSSMAIDTSGNLWAWGWCHATSTPIQIKAGTKFKEIAQANNYSLAIDTSGNLWTWGVNSNGGLGTGTTLRSSTPIQVKAGTQFKEIAASYFHTMAIDTSGNLWTWGYNDYGQLGNGTTTDSFTPVQIKSGTKFSKIAAGVSHSMAVDTSGNLWTWGSNTNGMLGNNGSNNSNSTVPVEITIIGSYEVTFKDGNSTVKTEDVIPMEAPTAPTITKTGYTLSWDKNLSYVNQDMTVNAVWTANTYTIAYNLDGGKSGTYAPTRGTYDQSVQITNPTKTGYTFKGWTSSSSAGLNTSTALIGTSSVPSTKWTGTLTQNTYFKNLTSTKNQTVTLTANWEIDKANLTINPNGGSVQVTPTTGQETITQSKTFTQNCNTTLRYGLPTKQNDISTQSYTINYSYNNATSGNTKTQDTATKTTNTYYSFSNWTKSSSFYGTLTSTTGSGTYTYPSNNGVTSTITANYTSNTSTNTTSVTLPAPSRIGYHFDGWYSNSTLTTKVGNAGASYTPTANITLYAKWIINTSNLTVNPNGGSVQVGNETITSSKTYTKDYNTSLEYSTPTKEDNVVTENYTINYSYNNATGENTKTQDTAIKTTTTNYEFTNWTKSSPFYGVLSSTMGSGTYIYPENNGVTSAITANYTSNTSTKTASVTLPTPIRTGYSFEGWYTNPELTTKLANAGETYTPTSNVTLYAKWTANGNTAYKVEHYKQNVELNGYELAQTEDKEGTTDTTATAVVKEYEGFTENTEYAERIPTGTITADGNLVLKLYYDRKMYEIKVDTTGGEGTEEHPYGEIITLPELERPGYTFGGWFDNEEFTGDPITQIEVNEETAQKEYHVKWIPNVYEVTLDPNGGTINSGNVTEYTYAQGATLPTDVSKPGYTFAGWYDNEELEGTPVTQITPTDLEDKQFYAKWTANGNTAYKVEHYKQNVSLDGYELAETEEKADLTDTKVTAVAKEYEGFIENTECSERVAEGIVSSDGNLVLKLYYDRKMYDIKIDTTNGDGEGTEKHPYGEIITLPELERPGYTFGGWYDNEEFTGDPITQIEVNEETAQKEYHVKWIPNVYEVTLDPNGGTINSGNVTEYTYAQGATLPIDVTKPGYTFAGWYDNEQLEGTPVTEITTTDLENKQYHAKWTVNTNTPYKIEYYVRNLDTEVEGYDLFETENKTGTTDTTATAIAKEFEGLTENIEYAGRVVSGNINGDGSLVLKLYYNRNTYNITYELNEGTADIPLTNIYTYGKEFVLSNRVSKQGCVFLGWYNNEALEGNPVTSIGNTEIGDKTFYAKWSVEEEYYITSKVYNINTEENYITKVSPETSVSKLINNIQTNGTPKVINLKGEEVSGKELVGTGYKLQVTFKGETNEYEIAVRGDLDGNGTITITDLSILNQTLVNTITLTGIKEKAADLDYRGGITITDLSVMNQALVGKIEL